MAIWILSFSCEHLFKSFVSPDCSGAWVIRQTCTSSLFVELSEHDFPRRRGYFASLFLRLNFSVFGLRMNRINPKNHRVKLWLFPFLTKERSKQLKYHSAAILEEFDSSQEIGIWGFAFRLLWSPDPANRTSTDLVLHIFHSLSTTHAIISQVPEEIVLRNCFWAIFGPTGLTYPSPPQPKGSKSDWKQIDQLLIIVGSDPRRSASNGMPQVRSLLHLLSQTMCCLDQAVF